MTKINPSHLLQRYRLYRRIGFTPVIARSMAYFAILPIETDAVSAIDKSYWLHRAKVQK